MQNTTIEALDLTQLNVEELEIFIEDEKLKIETLEIELNDLNKEEVVLDNQIEELQEVRRLELLERAKDLRSKKAELKVSLSAARVAVKNKRSIVEELSATAMTTTESNAPTEYNIAGTIFTLKQGDTFKSKNVTSLIKALTKLSTAEERVKVIEDLKDYIDDKGMARIERKVNLVTVKDAVTFIEDTEPTISSVHIISNTPSKNIIPIVPDTVTEKWFLDDWTGD